jgi:4-hydroxy-tetrahydrodipicolinate synthase
MMETMPVTGVFAAVLTPRNANGDIDTKALEHSLQFLMSKGIEGFALNGATGEFCITTLQEFETILQVTADLTRGKASFIAGIGAASENAAIQLGKIASRSGAAALLLPMPYFFPYSQDDLSAFCRSVAAKLDTSILLYNLPQFSSGLLPQTTANLITECDNIVGIKDSSGSLDTVRLLTHNNISSCRIIGNDGALPSALEERLCDGVVSGVACVLPELMQDLYKAGRNRTSQAGEFDKLTAQLHDFIVQLDVLPVPWGLKVIAEMRGIAQAHYALTLSGSRMQNIAAFQQWFTTNRTSLLGAQL